MVESTKILGEKRLLILSEIDSWRKDRKNGISWYAKFNNFISILPSKDFPGGSMKASLAQSLGEIDITHRQANLGIKMPPYSDYYLDQTPRQFLEKVIEAIEISGVSRERIEELQHDHFLLMEIYNNSAATPTEDSHEALKMAVQIHHTLLELAIPIYIELRLSGCNHDDLAA